MSLDHELSRPVMLEPWPDEPIEVAVGTTAAERQALAARLGLPAVHTLEARCRIDPLSQAGVLVVTGEIVAEVVQECVVSLEPLDRHVRAPFERHLARADAMPPVEDHLLDPDAIDVEPLEGVRLDVGELVTEELALALEPYPHAEGAYQQVADLGPDVTFGEETDRQRPFAALATLAS